MDTFATLREEAGRVFDDETASEFHERVQAGGRPLMQITHELGIQPSMLRNWRNAVGGAFQAPLKRHLFAYIEGYYNRQRLCCAFGGRAV